MFSPNVLKLLPWVARTLITLLVRGTDESPVLLGSCADTMNCSFKTSCTAFSDLSMGVNTRTSYQDSDNGVMVGVVYVVRKLFDELEKLADERIINPDYLHHQQDQLSATLYCATSCDAVHSVLNTPRSFGRIR